MIVLTNPVEAEGARDFDRELSGLPRGRPQRGDPGIEVLGEQASTKLPSHLPPDGVEHPPTPRCSDRQSDSSRYRARLYPHVGTSRRIPRIDKPFTAAVASDTPPHPAALLVPGATASNPPTSIMCKKVICCEEATVYRGSRTISRWNFVTNAAASLVTSRASSGIKFSCDARSARRAARESELRVRCVRKQRRKAASLQGSTRAAASRAFRDSDVSRETPALPPPPLRSMRCQKSTASRGSYPACAISSSPMWSASDSCVRP